MDKSLQYQPHYALWTSEESDENGDMTHAAILHGMFKTEKEALKAGRDMKLNPDFNYITHEIIQFQETGYHPVMGLDEDYGSGGYKYLWEFENAQS